MRLPPKLNSKVCIFIFRAVKVERDIVPDSIENESLTEALDACPYSPLDTLGPFAELNFNLHCPKYWNISANKEENTNSENEGKKSIDLKKASGTRAKTI